MGACASMTGTAVSVHVYTIVDAEEDPLFAMMALPYGVRGVYLCTVKVGNSEFAFDAGDRPPPPASQARPAVPARHTGAAAPAAPPPTTTQTPAPGQPPAGRKGGIITFPARRVHRSSKPPENLHGAESVSGMKGDIAMGTTALSRAAVERIVDELRSAFNASTYNLEKCNPNHFADALCRKLVGKGLPEWCNHAASVGAQLGLDLDASLADIARFTRGLSSEPQLRPTSQQPHRAAAPAARQNGGGGVLGGLFGGGGRAGGGGGGHPSAVVIRRGGALSSSRARSAEEEEAAAAAGAMVLGLATAMVAISLAEAIVAADQDQGRRHAGGARAQPAQEGNWFGGLFGSSTPQSQAPQRQRPGAAATAAGARFEEVSE